MSTSELENFSPSRRWAADWVESTEVRNFIIGCILLNALTLGLETSPAVVSRIGFWLHWADLLVLGVFVIELLLKLYAFQWRFFRNPWYVFDFVIVVVALMPSSGAFAAMRTLRVLRVLRSVSMVPGLRRIATAMLQAIPGIGYTSMLLLIIYYVFAIIGIHLYQEDFPEWFGSLGSAMYTLFQIMTLESWSMGIVRPIMEIYPSAWMYFIPFLLVTTFAVMNLFIAILVDTMQNLDKLERKANHVEEITPEDTHREVLALREEIAELRELLRKPS